MRRGGISILEVLVALVLLAVGSAMFFRSSDMAMDNEARAQDWHMEALAIENAVEAVRATRGPAEVAVLDTQFLDSSQGPRLGIRLKGSPVATIDGRTFPPGRLASLDARAWREIGGAPRAETLAVRTLVRTP